MRFYLQYVPISLLLASSPFIVLGVNEPITEPANITPAGVVDASSPAGEDAAQTPSSEISDGEAVSSLSDSTPPADMIPSSLLEETAVLSSDKEIPPADMIPPSKLEKTVSSGLDSEAPPADMVPPSDLEETVSSSLDKESPPADMIPPPEFEKTVSSGLNRGAPPADMVPPSELEKTVSSSLDTEEAPPADMIPPSELAEGASVPAEESILPVPEDSEAPSSDNDFAQTDTASMSDNKANKVPPVMSAVSQTPAPNTPAVQYEPQNPIISSFATVAESLLNQKAARDNYAYQLARQQAEQKALQQNYAAARAADQVRLNQQVQLAQQDQYFRQNQLAQNAQRDLQNQLVQQSFHMQQQARMNNQYPSPVPYPAQAPYNQNYLAEEAAANARFQAEVALRERNRQKQLYLKNALRPADGTQSYSSGQVTQMQTSQDIQSRANESELKETPAKENRVDNKSNIFVQAKETPPEEASEEEIEKQIAEAKFKLEAIKVKKTPSPTERDVKDKPSVDDKANTEVLPKTEKQAEKKSESNEEFKKPALKEKPSDTSSSEKKPSLSIMKFFDKSVQKPSKKITTLGERELLKENETLNFDEHGNPHKEDSENLENPQNKENTPPSSAKKQVKLDEKVGSPAEQKS